MHQTEKKTSYSSILQQKYPHRYISSQID